MAKTTFVTPVGTAKYPHIAKPDNYKGQLKYKTWLVITPEEAEVFKKKLEDFVDANRSTITAKKPKLPLRREEDKEGNLTGNFEINAKSDYQPAVFDSHNQKLPPDTRIGGGSKLRLLVEPYAYDEGVSLRLKQVQVVELVEYGSGSESAFDEIEDGYHAEGFTEETEDALDI